MHKYLFLTAKYTLWYEGFLFSHCLNSLLKNLKPTLTLSSASAVAWSLNMNSVNAKNVLVRCILIQTSIDHTSTEATLKEKLINVTQVLCDSNSHIIFEISYVTFWSMCPCVNPLIFCSVEFIFFIATILCVYIFVCRTHACQFSRLCFLCTLSLWCIS